MPRAIKIQKANFAAAAQSADPVSYFEKGGLVRSKIKMKLMQYGQCIGEIHVGDIGEIIKVKDSDEDGLNTVQVSWKRQTCIANYKPSYLESVVHDEDYCIGREIRIHRWMRTITYWNNADVVMWAREKLPEKYRLFDGEINQRALKVTGYWLRSIIGMDKWYDQREGFRTAGIYTKNNDVIPKITKLFEEKDRYRNEQIQQSKQNIMVDSNGTEYIKSEKPYRCEVTSPYLLIDNLGRKFLTVRFKDSAPGSRPTNEKRNLPIEWIVNA